MEKKIPLLLLVSWYPSIQETVRKICQELNLSFYQVGLSEAVEIIEKQMQSHPCLLIWADAYREVDSGDIKSILKETASLPPDIPIIVWNARGILDAAPNPCPEEKGILWVPEGREKLEGALKTILDSFENPGEKR